MKIDQAMITQRAGLGAGMTLGGFLIEKRLGKGGMGEVFLARQISMDRQVALKVLSGELSQDKERVERFLKEVKVLARLEHPHIVTAYEAGSDSGMLYMAMAYVPGQSLQARLEREGPLDEVEALKLTRKLAQALAYAWHDHRLLHLDVKPENVLLDTRGEPRLVDFGLARTLEGKDAKALSESVFGTPNYMSPEQARGEEDLDFRSDLYSLGATLHHMVTGEVPFGSDSVEEVLRKRMVEPLPDPRVSNPKVSERCVAVLESMLAIDRENRYGSWEALLRDLDRLLVRPVTRKTRPVTGKVDPSKRAIRVHTADLHGSETNGKPVARGKGALAAVFPILGALIFGAGIFFWVTRKPAETPKKEVSKADLPPSPAIDERAAQEAKEREAAEASEAAEKAAQAERERVAAELAAEQAAQEAKAREESAARACFNDALADVAGLLLKPDYPKARERIEALCADPAAALLKAEADAMAVLVGQGVDPDGPILRSLERQKGETVKVETKKGTVVEAQITKVADGLAYLRQTLQGGRVEYAFGPRDLSVRERLTRLGEGEAPETRIQRGLVLGHEGGAWDLAEKEFAAGGPLGEALAGVLKSRREEREAQAALASPASSQPSEQVQTVQDRPGTITAPALAKDAATTAKPSPPKVAAPAVGLEDAIATLKKDNPKFAGTVTVDRLGGGKIGITLGNDENLQDIRALAGLPLVSLTLNNCAVDDLSPLAGMPLENLKVMSSSLKDLSPLSGLTQLKVLFIRSPRVDDLRPLRALAQLENLTLQCFSLFDLDSLEGLQLTALSITYSRISDLKPLAGMPLKSINFGSPPLITDLSPLKDCPLESLSIVESKVKSLAPLSAKMLRRVAIYSSPISDLKPLSGMPLEEVVLSRITATDISPLKSSTLKHLRLSDLPIRDLQSLSGCPVEILSVNHLTKVTDMDKLPDCFPMLKVLEIPEEYIKPAFIARFPHLNKLYRLRIGESSKEVPLNLLIKP